MFLCFHVHQNTCFLVFSPFSAYFYPPPMDKGLLILSPQCTVVNYSIQVIDQYLFWESAAKQLNIYSVYCLVTCCPTVLALQTCRDCRDPHTALPVVLTLALGLLFVTIAVVLNIGVSPTVDSLWFFIQVCVCVTCVSGCI